MKLDEDYKKVINELHENFGWSSLDILPGNYQDLLNDTIMAVKNLTIQRAINLVCPKCGNTGRCEPRTLSDPDGQECDCWIECKPYTLQVVTKKQVEGCSYCGKSSCNGSCF